MGRLFISQREINFINDIAKEVVKDVIGQKIYYFPISEIKELKFWKEISFLTVQYFLK
jgi:hypothetical protein